MEATRPFFILEMANNHMGDVEHGLRIVRAFADVVRDFPEFAFAFKLQYRDLDTFIHPSAPPDAKHVKRFRETRLREDDFRWLQAEMRAHGFQTACTPFDEPSVDKVVEHGFDYLKIGSCSFTDWPLLERIALCDLPIIASTAGASLADIDSVVSFFEHRGKKLSLLHCVASYPTDEADLQLNQIELLRVRYPQLRVGFSSHDHPDAYASMLAVVCQGATIFERHVALPTDRYPANAYSSTPEKLRYWLIAARRAFAMCGIAGRRATGGEQEEASLHALRRGVFASRDLPSGALIQPEDYRLAFPAAEGQLLACDLSKFCEFTTGQVVAAGAPLMREALHRRDHRALVRDILRDVKAQLRESHVILPSAQSDLELSHHYGLERFREVGIVALLFVNREYCKKVLVMLPGQRHPEHLHRQKEETFLVLHGEMTLSLDGVAKTYRAGDMVLVGRGVLHGFATTTGVVFEEISSTHVATDSYYTDPSIMANGHRKTLLTYWMD